MTLQGIDISNLQGEPSAYRTQPWYEQAEFIIAQAIPRPLPNGWIGDQLRAALEDGKHRGIYTWMWDTPSWRMGDQTVGGDLRARLATVPDDVPLDIRPWEDLEDNQSAGWQGVSVQTRIDNARRALDVLDTWAAGRGLPAAGIYTSTYFLGLLYGGWDCDGRMLWKAHYGIAPGSLIGGNVVAHQYSSTPIDMDVLLESEIVTAAPPEDEDVDQGWLDKKALVVSLAGELRDVADQIRVEAQRKAGPRKTVVQKLADAVSSRADQILA